MDAALQSRPHRWGLGAFLLAEVVYLLTSLALAVLFGGQQVVSVSTVVLVVALPTLLAAAVAILASKVRGKRSAYRLEAAVVLAQRRFGRPLRARWAVRHASRGGAVAFGRRRGGELGGRRRVRRSARDVGVGCRRFLLSSCSSPPVCEEIVYRGLLWDAVDRRWGGRRVALLVTTVVFAIAHLELTRIPLLLVVALPIGLARFFVGDLTASILAHQVTNLLPGLVLMLTVAGAIPPA